jgi:group I intron endonuclease
MKTVYLLCGVPGTGKSWIAEKVSHLVKYVSYDKQGYVEPTATIELHDRPVHISTTIKRWRSKGINVVPLFVAGNIEKVKDQLLKRGGRVTPNFDTRWKRVLRLSERYGVFTGSSDEVLAFLLETLQHRSTSHFIYKATAPNGKVYIGKTNQPLDKRTYDHYWLAKRSKTLFAKALNKYGDQIVWEILEQPVVGLELANDRERYWISRFRSNDKKYGYNLTEGGDGGKRSPESEKKRIRSVIKALKSPETKAKLSDKSKAMWRTNRNEMSSAIRKTRSTSKSRALTSQRSREAYANPAVRKKLGESVRRRYSDPNERKKTSDSGRSARARMFSGWTREGEFVGSWLNKTAAAEELGIPYTGISNVLAGRLAHTRGYVFRYISESNDPQTRGGCDESGPES